MSQSRLERRSNIWNNIIRTQKPEEFITLKINNKSIVVSNQITSIDIIKNNTFKNKQEILALQFNNALIDLNVPLYEYLEHNIIYTIVPVYFSDPKGQHIFWHSSAHVLGYALEILYDAQLLIGPPVTEGFYYDAEIKNFTNIKIEEINDEMNKIIKLAYNFERKKITIAQAFELFAENSHKLEILNKLDPDELITAYKCGDFIDLCRGPHLINTKIINVSRILNITNTCNNEIKRFKAISFPTNKGMKLFNQEEVRRLNFSHQTIGAKQELFFFHEFSPGSCFFLPHGTRMLNRMIEVMREFYYQKRFEEVCTPNIFKSELYKISGHYEHYKDNMYNFNCEKDEFFLKPMNCPGHCLIFGHKTRSYNELPLRYADFGVLHRNELSNTLSGLSRVRRFCQDDAHIFCTREQIKEEISNAIHFLKEVYNLFGFKFFVELSTRPNKFGGEVEIWNYAENILQEILVDNFGNEWKINPGDGAFYGPKLDFHLLDKFNRSFQCATIQLDFVLPEKFKLEYTNDKNEYIRPVIIHRAIYGSVERFFALMIENYEGIYPLWLSPRQIMIIPVNENCKGYANEIYNKLRESQLYVDVNFSDNTLNKKITLASKLEHKYNYIVIVGDTEVNDRTVSVRDINANKFNCGLNEFIERVNEEIKQKK